MGQDLIPNIDVSHAWEREDIEGGLLLLWVMLQKEMTEKKREKICPRNITVRAERTNNISSSLCT